MWTECLFDFLIVFTICFYAIPAILCLFVFGLVSLVAISTSRFDWKVMLGVTCLMGGGLIVALIPFYNIYWFATYMDRYDKAKGENNE